MSVPFVPREKEIAEVSKLILNHMRSHLITQDYQQEEDAKIIQVFGISKVGKRWLAERIGQNVKQLCEHDGFIHMKLLTYLDKDLISELSSGNSLSLSVGQKFGHSNQGSEEEKIRVTLVLLLGVENISPDKLQSILYDFLSYDNIHCIFTTCRKFHFVRLGSHLKNVQLQVLNSKECRTYLGQFVIHWSQNLSEIVKQSAGFPYILHFAAKKFVDGALSEKEIFTLVGEEKRALKKHLEIEYKGSFSSKNLRTISFITGPFTPKALANVGNVASKSAIKREIVEDLSDCGILSSSSVSEDKYFVNCLMRSIWEEKYGLNKDSDRMLQNRFCAYYAKLLGELDTVLGNKFLYKVFEEEFPNITKLVERAVYCVKEQYDILIEVAHKAEYLIIVFLEGKEQVSFYQACLEAAKERKNVKDVARMNAAFGHSLLIISADVKVALNYLEDALNQMVKGGFEAYELAMVVSSVGQAYQLQGNHLKAIRYFKKALKHLTLSKSGPVSDTNLDDSPFRLTIQTRIFFFWSQAFTGLGRYEAAQEKLNVVLFNIFKTWGYHPRLGPFLNYKGMIARLQGNKKEAFRYGKEGLRLRLQSKKQASAPITYSLCHVAMGYLEYLGDTERAMLHIQDAFDNIEAADPNHPNLSFIYHCKGEVYKYKGEWEEAQNCYKKAATLRWEIYGIGANCCSAESLQCVGDMCCKLGDSKGALQYYVKCQFVLLEYYFKNDAVYEKRIKVGLEKLEEIVREKSPEGAGFIQECILSCNEVLEKTAQNLRSAAKSRKSFRSCIHWLLVVLSVVFFPEKPPQ